MKYSRIGSYRDRKGPLAGLSSGFWKRLALTLTDVANALDLADYQANTCVDLGPGHS